MNIKMARGYRSAIVAAILTALGYASPVSADEMVSFATGGYARGLRTIDIMHKMDSNKDDRVSKAEWDAFQTQVFEMLDVDHSGYLDRKEFLNKYRDDMVSFATGGYAAGLRSEDLWKKMDADHDGKVSRKEFLDFNERMFVMMDKSKTGMLDPTAFLGKH